MPTSRTTATRHPVRDEIANAVTHGIGFVLSLVGLALLLVFSIIKGDARHIASFTVYGACLVVTYGSSMLYHTEKSRRRKLRLRVLDHCAIFLLIAGSYTPFMVVALDSGFGWVLLGVVWALAIAGICRKLFVSARPSGRSTMVYVALGWFSVLAIVPLYKALGWQGFLLLVAGGLAYTAGTFFFHQDHRRYFHAIWHLFVLTGSGLHFAAVMLFLVPWY